MMSAAFVYICKQKRNFDMDRLSLKKTSKLEFMLKFKILKWFTLFELI